MIRDFQYFTLAPVIDRDTNQYLFTGGIEAVGDASVLNQVILEYRFVYDVEIEDAGASEWQAYEVGQEINKQEPSWFGVQFRNASNNFSSYEADNGNYYHIKSTYIFDAGGRLMTLANWTYGNDSNIPDYAFQSLFIGTPINSAMELIFPNTTSMNCYKDMFSKCDRLFSAPELPATTLADYCYCGMFSGCQSLQAAPALPSTRLASHCYENMFENCTSLTTAPELPATRLADYCYQHMFEGCSSLTAAPALPAWNLASYCYASMFNNCNSLTTAPRLTATTLYDYCYYAMFGNCTSLATPPTLRSTALANGCYASMFNNCTSLTTAPELPATTLANYCYSWMFNGCTSLTQAPELPATTLANFCYQYMFASCSSLTAAPSLPATTLNDYCYQHMFEDCSSLTTAPELPATTLSSYCYSTMFNGCSSLTAAPALPATTLAGYCYYYMFRRCSSLTQAPELPVTTLKSYCYYGMFEGCGSLTQAPELPATTLESNCYARMFAACWALEHAPVLHATYLAQKCYEMMFYACQMLKGIVWKSKTLPSSTYCNIWLQNANPSGTFEYTQPFLDVASIPRNVSGVPEGWNIQQLKPQAGISLKINNKDVNKFMLLGKNISSLSINGVKVKSSTPIGTDVELPSWYTKLLYVDSNGGSLDTGIPTNGYLKVGIKWSKTKTGNSQWPEMFGNRAIPGVDVGEYYQAFSFRCNTASKHYDYYHGLYSASSPTYGGRVDIAESSTALGDTVHEYWMDPTRFSFDGQIFNTVDYANTHEKDGHTDWEYQPERLNGQTMVLFSSRTGRREAIINCYNFYIVDTSTNTVLINYVPCKYGTQAGFYDTVSQTFVTNSKFLAGPEA